VETRVRVRWTDLDAFGHVNNAVYLTYLEEGRDRFVDAAFSDSFEDFVVAHISIDYRNEITQVDEEIVVESVLTGYGRSSVRTAERILKADGTVAAEATTVLVAVNREAGTSRPLSERELKSLEALSPNDVSGRT
jgi:acyl-CoA thioester hydrolase